MKSWHCYVGALVTTLLFALVVLASAAGCKVEEPAQPKDKVRTCASWAPDDGPKNCKEWK